MDGPRTGRFTGGLTTFGVVTSPVQGTAARVDQPADQPQKKNAQPYKPRGARNNGVNSVGN